MVYEPAKGVNFTVEKQNKGKKFLCCTNGFFYKFIPKILRYEKIHPCSIYVSIVLPEDCLTNGNSINSL